MFKIIEKTKIWFSISLAIILVGVVLMATRGLNFGIDFKGGTKIVVDFGGSFDKVEADGIVKEYADDAVTKTVESTQYEIKSKDLDETKTAFTRGFCFNFTKSNRSIGWERVNKKCYYFSISSLCSNAYLYSNKI